MTPTLHRSSTRLLFALLCALCGQQSTAASKPNVIIIWTDDQGYADLSVHGNKDYQTPHLDSLAKNGVRCTSGYVSQPQCSPSRAGMITGRHHAEPFFLYVPHDFPHVPQVTDEKYLKRVAHIADEKRRAYASMMLAVDDGMGAILAVLRKHGIEDNTLIFYMSDNGGPADGRLPCSNGIFTGAKGGMSEGGSRVPLIANWKGTITAGGLTKDLVDFSDLLPTFIDIAGAAKPVGVTLDGRYDARRD